VRAAGEADDAQVATGLKEETVPFYDQSCPDCGKLFEVERRITDDSPVFCPDCGAETRRLISHTSFSLKAGSSGGWADGGYGQPKPADPKPVSKGPKEL